MIVDGKNYQGIWLDESDHNIVKVIDQNKLPFFFETVDLCSVEEVYTAIKDMTVRGAPLIGAAGAFGIYFATLEITNHTDIREHLSNAARYLTSCRPTAVNLSWAVKYAVEKIKQKEASASISETALKAALEICVIEKGNNKKIGENGLKIIEKISREKGGKPVNILTHCNAGWLACIDYGTVTAPVYMANKKGIALHIWVDETRPKNQGARLTCWELGKEGVPYTLIPDNAGGHLMQSGMVDLVLVGCDRATRKGDVANKIGTYLKALSAFDNNVPFYAVVPTTSFDLEISNGLKEIMVEERDPEEVTMVTGFSEGEIKSVRICPAGAEAGNWAFDITPARLITGLITEKGVCTANEEEIIKMFSDKQI